MRERRRILALVRKTERENIGFLERSSEEELASWMLDGLNLRPVGYRDDRSPATHFCEEFEKLSKSTQEKLKQVLIQAISSWDTAAHKAEVLSDLAFVSGYLRIEGTLPHLIRIVDEKLVSPEDEKSHQSQSVVVSVVSGFATNELAKAALKKWYADENFDWKYEAIICLGLMEAEPHNSPVFLSQFLRVVDEHPNYFRLDYTAVETAMRIGPDELENILEGFDSKSAKEMIQAIPVAREIIEESKKG